MAIFIMLNNFFHDFSVALLFACLIALSIVYRHLSGIETGFEVDFFFRLYLGFRKIIIGCWIFIIIGGVIRTLAYREYEWMEAAGKGQIAALVIKHILLVTLVVWGSIIQVRLKRRLNQLAEGQK